ncbi:hypothetical protein [Pseudorhodobacter sp.]|uniref:hypothetical protein n=1 Tax=Pseudorhodobacter sp. TaxID=1934400 RepID=UPI00264723F0|nr:hypothetical protein [Pseudorhodobacter sp.]MDN5788241.1 nitrile hydratase subunit alpha [Pseudorhodobacter sp.]
MADCLDLAGLPLLAMKRCAIQPGPPAHDRSNSLLPPDPALRAMAPETLLVASGLVDLAVLDVIIDPDKLKVGLRDGAALVAL